MADKKIDLKALNTLKDLGLIAKDTDGSLLKMKKSLEEVNGVVQAVDANLSSTNLTIRAFDVASKIIGTLPAQLAEFTEELKKMSDFYQSLRRMQLVLFVFQLE